MLKIGKLEDADNEKINVQITTLEQWHFEDGKKKNKTSRPELEIEIEGTINNNTYRFDFYIEKPFEEYLNMKNYERIELHNSQYHEDFASLNDEYETFPDTKIDVVRVNSVITFVVHMKSAFDDYFITSEFNVPLTTIENALKKD
jgi:hypothetical protein